MPDADPTTAVIALGVLVLVFVIGTVSKLQMGIAAIVAAAIVGPLLFGETIHEIQQGFPLSLFFTLLGVTYLFALATNNGTVNWLVKGGLRMVGGHAAVFPFVMFAVTALLTAIGAATPAAAAILMPIALSFSRRNGLNPLPMAQAIIQGATAGSFSPMGVYGVIVNSVVERSGPQLMALYNPTVTWVVVIAVSLIIVSITWLMYRRPAPANEDADDDAPFHTRILVETAMGMIDVIRADEMRRLSRCAAADCEGIVLDLSRNRSRKYCSTACTNRAAVAAYRARQSDAGRPVTPH